MLEKGDSYSETTSYDNSISFTSNTSTATTLTSTPYHHKKRRLDHVIGELNSEYNANQVGDISSTTSSSRHQLSDSVHVLGLSQNFDSYNGHSSIPSSPRQSATHRHQVSQTDSSGTHHNHHFIRASTIKLLDTYQVLIATSLFYICMVSDLRPGTQRSRKSGEGQRPKQIITTIEGNCFHSPFLSCLSFGYKTLVR